MNKPTLRTLEQEPQKKSVIPAIAGGIVFALSLFWIIDHLAGGCVQTLAQAVTFCPIKQ